nr:NPCBM/NEW2 domain-containing protein [Streptomyces sp. Y2F8-2]
MVPPRPLGRRGAGVGGSCSGRNPFEDGPYRAGKCTRMTAYVGVDEETGGAGTVTFSVIADGKTLVTTPTIRGRQAAVPIDADVSGAQVIGLKVGDAGDGNGNDHGDWAMPTLTCR